MAVGMVSEFFSNVLAIVVTWNPDITQFKESLASYRNQCRVLIVDNGSEKSILSSIQSLCDEDCKLLALAENKGIASALNEGMKFSKKRVLDYVVLLDQDSLFNESTLKTLIEASQALQGSGVSIPVVGPVPINSEKGKAIGMYNGFECGKNMPPLEVESLYTSGMLIPQSLAVKALQRDDFFIDYVDTEWCYRVRYTYGATIYVVPQAYINHKVGDSELDMGLIRKQPLLVHKPIRQYYQLRNAIWMGRCSYIPLRARIKILTRCFARVVILGIAVAPRITRLKYISCALVDGIRCRPGQWEFIPSYVREMNRT